MGSRGPKGPGDRCPPSEVSVRRPLRPQCNGVPLMGPPPVLPGPSSRPVSGPCGAQAASCPCHHPGAASVLCAVRTSRHGQSPEPRLAVIRALSSRPRSAHPHVPGAEFSETNVSEHSCRDRLSLLLATQLSRMTPCEQRSVLLPHSDSWKVCRAVSSQPGAAGHTWPAVWDRQQSLRWAGSPPSTPALPVTTHSCSGGLVAGGQASRGQPGRAPPALPTLCVGEASGHRAGTALGRHPVRG